MVLVHGLDTTVISNELGTVIINTHPSEGGSKHCSMTMKVNSKVFPSDDGISGKSQTEGLILNTKVKTLFDRYYTYTLIYLCRAQKPINKFIGFE